jgi:hypothetical protein
MNLKMVKKFISLYKRISRKASDYPKIMSVISVLYFFGLPIAVGIYKDSIWWMLGSLIMGFIITPIIFIILAIMEDAD